MSSPGGLDAAQPQSLLVVGQGGVLYGVTPYGGLYNQGAIFALAPPSSPGGAWREAVLYSFEITSSNGGSPLAAIGSSNGLLFGPAGQDPGGTAGTIWEFTP